MMMYGRKITTRKQESVTKDNMEIVSALKRKVADKVGQQKFELWFTEEIHWAIEDSALVLSSAARFMIERLRRTLAKAIHTAVVQANLNITDVYYRLSEEKTPTAKKQVVAHRRRDEIKPAATTEIRKPAKHRKTLANYIVGTSNQLAVTAAQMMIQNRATPSPLFIYGPSGCGKTHLLQAIWNHTRREVLSGRALYITAEQFTTHFTESISGGGTPSFRGKYRNVDLLVVDDIDFFPGKRATAEEFHYTVDDLLREQKQLVFSAKQVPSEISGLNRDLVARLSSGLGCDLGLPDERMRFEIGKLHCQRLGFMIMDEVIEMAVERSPGDCRHLFGILNRIHAMQLSHGKPVTPSVVDSLLIDLIKCNKRPVRLHDIERAICDVFGIETKMLHSNGRKANVSRPRMLAMWLARKHTKSAFSEIGEYFGNRAHNTVIAAEHRVNEWIAENASIPLAFGACPIQDAIERVEATLLSV